MTGVSRASRTPGYEALSSTLVANDTLELQAQGENLAAIAGALPLDRVRRVLDVGCGTGALARTIARCAGDAVEVVGVDLAANHIAEARRLTAAAGLSNVRFLAAGLDGSDLGGRFDLVCEKYVLMTMLPRAVGRAFVASLKQRTAPGGWVALIEADINFGADRYPPAPEPLATVLPRIVEFYRSRDLIEWRCGLRIFDHLREAALTDIRVTVADGRVIQGGLPAALVEHANTDVEALIAPCLEEMRLSHRIGDVAAQWREYAAGEAHFLYHPIFVGTGKVTDD